MREIQESKEKVEFSLDNRQVFFGFFGLSVVGCFVFALGVMVGRQDGGAAGGAKEGAIASQGAAAPLIAGLETIPEVTPEGAAGLTDAFAFKHGLAAPATEGMPETRDPKVPPREEKALRAQREAEEKRKKASKESTLARLEPRVGTAKGEAPLAGARAPEPALPGSKIAAALEPGASEGAVNEANEANEAELRPEPRPDPAAVMASSARSGEAPQLPSSPKATRAFTLQLKAYASADEAEKMAEKMRRNGHDARVEAGEVQGRTWHRVRIGSFTKWEDALAAKGAFEKQEQLIAYVVPR